MCKFGCSDNISPFFFFTARLDLGAKTDAKRGATQTIGIGMGRSHLRAGRRICKLLGYLGTFSKSLETTCSKWGFKRDGTPCR